MKYLLIVLFALIVPALSRPQQQQNPQQQYQQHPQSGSATTPVSIVSQTEVVGPDGSFNYSYDASNGIHVEQGGYVKKGAEGRAVDPNNPEDTGDIQVIQGAYSYTAPDGQQISVRYIADDNGFQPEGDHIPKAPEGIAQQQQQGFQQQPQTFQHQERQFQQQQFSSTGSNPSQATQA
ncbi:endocuticle structural glycoprotein SgAbd-2 [Tribolium castaneum]|uniref:endocuticle structural glycoprotein SgAbd-2 n=1 Tax=Tribolium castaneum TaxID=7070 RepID=UPI0030FDF85F